MSSFSEFFVLPSPPLAGEEQHINSRPLAALSVKAKSGGKKHLVPNPTLLLSCSKRNILTLQNFVFSIALQWRHWRSVSNSTLIPISGTRSNFNRDTNAGRDDPWLGSQWARASWKENHARNIVRISTLQKLCSEYPPWNISTQGVNRISNEYPRAIPPEFLTNQKLNIFPPWCFTSPQPWSSSRADQNIEIWERYARPPVNCIESVSEVSQDNPPRPLQSCVHTCPCVIVCIWAPRIQSPPPVQIQSCVQNSLSWTHPSLYHVHFLPRRIWLNLCISNWKVLQVHHSLKACLRYLNDEADSV